MGCCCSCLKGDDPAGLRSETELSNQNNPNASGIRAKLSIARSMTAPSIDIDRKGTTVSGRGLALAGAGIEQDAAYWEWHIHQVPEGANIMFGVATKKDRSFYSDLENQSDDDLDRTGRNLMRIVKVQSDDTVGVAVQQSDLPMVQFLLNGDTLYDLAINRFRGVVYPSIYLPESEEEIKVELVMNENQFRQMSPHPRFGPLIVVRSLI